MSATATGASALEPLLDQLADLLAEKLADRLAARLGTQATDTAAVAPTRRLLTLDELVDQLPAGKSATAWKRWLYERTRRGQVPGAHKIGGRLFFDPEHTIPWLTGAESQRVDLAGQQSLDQPPMPAQSKPEQRRRSGR